MLISAIAFFLLLTLLSALLPSKWLRYTALLASAGSFAFFGLFVQQPHSTISDFKFPILPELGVWLDFQIDGLSWAFVCLFMFISSFVFLYSFFYEIAPSITKRFYVSLFLFAASMLGLIISDNFFVFFVFWELTSLSSYLLVSLKDDKDDVRSSSRQVFFLTVFGGFFLLLALLWLQAEALSAGFSLEQASGFSSLLAFPINEWLSPGKSTGLLILFLIGAASKSAQFPFHFWLPQAMTAPTPVSSYLHSATMVKAGIFLIAKLYVAFHLLPAWTYILIPLGIFTAVYSAIVGLAQTDLKKLLAWSTVSALGLLLMLLGLGTDLAIKSFVVFVFAHALYKASLFQVAGNIDKCTGSRDVDQSHSLFPYLKWTALAGLLAALSKAGAPPFFGFIGKELILKSKLDYSSFEIILLTLAFVVNVILVMMAFLVGIRTFVRFKKSPAPNSSKFKKTPFGLAISPLFLGAVGLFVGLFPSVFDSTLGQAMTDGILGFHSSMDLKLWHGMKPSALIALGLSLGGFVVATGLLLEFQAWKKLYRSIVGVLPDARALLEFKLSFFAEAFKHLSRALYTRHRATYLGVMGGMLSLMILLGVINAKRESVSFLNPLELVVSAETLIFVAVALSIVLAAISVIFIQRFIAAAIVLGMVGVALSFVFAWFGAADLAITQLLTELLLAVLIASFGFRLGRTSVFRKEFSTVFRLIVAGGVGLCFYFAAKMNVPSDVSYQSAEFFAESSLTEAFGKNVVNVILVDFRALDTLNEALVVCLAAIGVSFLLKRFNQGVFR